MPKSLLQPPPRLDLWSTTNVHRLGVDAAAQWEAHLDAGRVGTRHPSRPAVVANRLRTATLFERIAQGGRR